jgi:hypothetical protein
VPAWVRAIFAQAIERRATSGKDVVWGSLGAAIMRALLARSRLRGD